MDLFRRKSVSALQAEAAGDHSLKRALGPLNLTALGIGAIIGTGIFVLTGTMAAQNAGPAVILSFVLAGVASVVAPMGALSAAYLMFYLDLETWIRLVVWLAIGLAIYFLYSRKHSRLASPGRN